MNRSEALRILGLPDDATADDVKAAYRETAQILHPDRFASNKKLQERATEQFKNLQEAYEVLTSKKVSRSASSPAGAAGAANPSRAAADIEARLAGISAARAQLLEQRDLALDERRNGLIMLGAGAVVALVFGRKLGVFAVIASIGVAAAVWGAVQAIGSHRRAQTLNEHLDELAQEKKKLLAQLDELG